jgi:hypothetical protein
MTSDKSVSVGLGGRKRKKIPQEGSTTHVGMHLGSLIRSGKPPRENPSTLFYLQHSIDWPRHRVASSMLLSWEGGVPFKIRC